MNRARLFGVSSCVVLGLAVIACGVEPGELEAVASDTAELNTAFCAKAEPKDVLIAQLVKDSWIARYPLTRLEVGKNGAIQGPDLPPLLKGNLDIINTVPEARSAVSTAVNEIQPLSDYGMGGISDEIEACSSVPAWTPSGETTVSTTAIRVQPTYNSQSWYKTHKAFSKVSALLKRFGDRDLVDPPGDGSTNLPPSDTVSTVGVQANVYGLCPAGSRAGTFCKLSYATGQNYMGRKCQYYYGYMRCLLY